MFQFNEDERVALTEDHPILELKAGDIGTIWTRYDTEPPAYDVTFRAPDGRDFDMVVNEDEIAAVSVSRELAASQRYVTPAARRLWRRL